MPIDKQTAIATFESRDDQCSKPYAQGSMSNCSEDTVAALFGQKCAEHLELPDAGSWRVKAMRVKLSRGRKEYEQLGEPQPLDIAMSLPLEGDEWWCPVEFDGARWKVHVVPPPWLSKGEWDEYQEVMISKALAPDEPYGKGFLRLIRDAAQGIQGDLSVSETDRKRLLDQMDMIFDLMEDDNDERLWNALETAFGAGQHFAKLFSHDEGIRIAKQGFKHVERQKKGRSEGAVNRSSKRKAATEAKMAYQRQREEIVELWQGSDNHNPHEFLDLLVSKGLAEEGASQEAGKYRLAGKGRFQTSDNAVRKIREWVKKHSATQ